MMKGLDLDKKIKEFNTLEADPQALRDQILSLAKSSSNLKNLKKSKEPEYSISQEELDKVKEARIAEKYGISKPIDKKTVQASKSGKLGSSLKNLSPFKRKEEKESKIPDGILDNINTKKQEKKSSSLKQSVEMVKEKEDEIETGGAIDSDSEISKVDNDFLISLKGKLNKSELVKILTDTWITYKNGDKNDLEEILKSAGDDGSGFFGGLLSGLGISALLSLIKKMLKFGLKMLYKLFKKILKGFFKLLKNILLHPIKTFKKLVKNLKAFKKSFLKKLKNLRKLLKKFGQKLARTFKNAAKTLKNIRKKFNKKSPKKTAKKQPSKGKKVSGKETSKSKPKSKVKPSSAKNAAKTASKNAAKGIAKGIAKKTAKLLARAPVLSIGFDAYDIYKLTQKGLSVHEAMLVNAYNTMEEGYVWLDLIDVYSLLKKTALYGGAKAAARNINMHAVNNVGAGPNFLKPFSYKGQPIEVNPIMDNDSLNTISYKTPPIEMNRVPFKAEDLRKIPLAPTAPLSDKYLGYDNLVKPKVYQDNVANSYLRL